MIGLAADAGQLLWVGFDGHELPDELAARLAASEAGGAILFRRNVRDLAQVAALCDAIHAAAPKGTPVLISVDQEGGKVQRLRAPATEWPSMLRLGERVERGEPLDRAAALAEQVGRALGDELAAVGFDLDFAPVLDVHTNEANPVIGERAFGRTPEIVTALAGGFARGLAAAGILSCGKHFPGHGDTALDSHLALPRVDHPLPRLEQVELAPFRALAAELPTLMTAHVVFAAIDPTVPATLSRAVMTDLLRGRLGYQGVVVSDDLEMKAIADNYGVEDAVVRGLLAGCDVFLLCHRAELQRQAFAALVKAGEHDAAVRTRIAESAARVRGLKARHAVAAAARVGRDPSLPGRAAHQALAKAMGAPPELGQHWTV